MWAENPVWWCDRPARSWWQYCGRCAYVQLLCSYPNKNGEEKLYEFQPDDKLAFVVHPKKGYTKDEILRVEGTLRELGYKNKTEAFQKLGIESKDYVVIPIPKMVTRLTDVFEEEKRLKIDIDGNSHYAVYTNDVASGRINTCEDVESYDSVLLVLITSLNKDDIDIISINRYK